MGAMEGAEARGALEGGVKEKAGALVMAEFRAGLELSEEKE